MFVNEAHEVDAMKEQALLAQEEFILRKIKGLLNKVDVFCSHASNSKKVCTERACRCFASRPKFCAKILQIEWIESNLK
jgi:hypothetical protein